MTMSVKINVICASMSIDSVNDMHDYVSELTAYDFFIVGHCLVYGDMRMHFIEPGFFIGNHII